ncbi:hypothetical protein [Metabacillus fastidiosus]|uniref:hypothetical protein n=1 Tax=Metabacillus fastidiosus TaxID=1458 RepID=UPI002DBAF72A|nr:hypothetical protein [Metabacillus fastidiosus]MEC2077219.1 hypothetical protein [Metabacillus fastidiosus]
MSFELKPEIKTSLEKIRFVDRYKEMSNRFNSNPDDSFENYEIDTVIEIIKNLGYDVSFDKKENFLKVGVIDNSPNYKIWFNIVLEYGITEFIWVVYHNNEVRLGSPWSVYSRLLIDPSERITAPIFRNYKELVEILKGAFVMYEDFKIELINLYSEQ